MAHIVIMGAGLAGAIMAYEIKEQLRPEDVLTGGSRARTASPRVSIAI